MKIKKWEVIPPMVVGARQIYQPHLVIENDKGELWIKQMSSDGDGEWEQIKLPEEEG